MRFDSLSYYYYYYYEFDHPQQRRNHHHHRNIVATVNLDCKLDLKTIAFHARNVEYNPKVRRRRRRARRAIHHLFIAFVFFSSPAGGAKERNERADGMVLLLIFMLFNKTALCRGYHEDQEPQNDSSHIRVRKMVCTEQGRR